MIVEERDYTLCPGCLPQFLDLYERLGWPVQHEILGHCLGYYLREVGDVNGVTHLWGYADFADRETRRQKLSQSPEWQAFLPQVLGFIQRMENRILTPARFFKPAVNPVDAPLR